MFVRCRRDREGSSIVTTKKETNSLRAWVDAALVDLDHPEKDHAPLEAYVHGIGTDVEHDLIPLWKLTVAVRPRVVLELGTRRAVSTRTLAHACQRVGAILFTCDPDPGCAPFLRGVPAIAFRCMGEQLFSMDLFPSGSVDVLFVDTDPHSFEQTTQWLRTWCVQILSPNGLAIFHDVNGRDVSSAPRPDIQVKAALLDWISPTPAGDELYWEYVELGHDGAGGLGVLRRRT